MKTTPFDVFLTMLILMQAFWVPQARGEVDHSGQMILIVVKDVVEPEVHSQIERLESDLQNSGYSTKVISTGVSNAQDLWNILSSEYNDANQNPVGAILIGSLPQGRCDSTTDAAYWNMEQYCNLSTFHIWVSRIKGSINQIKWAMDAHHYYRTGQSRLPERAEYLMDAYPDMEYIYYPNDGANALEVWPEVQKADLPTDWFGRTFGSWKYGAELLDETMHGSSFRSKVSKLSGHPCQTRFNMITSCSSASAAWALTVTRAGGAVFSVGATTTTYTGAFVILRSRTQDILFRQLLAEGNSLGDALVQRYPFDDRYRAMYYGDLSLPVMASQSNLPPVVDSFSADKTTGPAPLTVEFSAEATDTDDSIVLHEWFCEGYRQNGITMEPQYSNMSSVQTHTYQLAHRYLAEFQVMDQFRARAWAQPVTIAVSPTPGTILRINCGRHSRYAVADFDYRDDDGNLWLHDQDYLNDGTWGWSSNHNETNIIGGDIGGTELDDVFAYYRKTRDGTVSYHIPIQNGRYKVTVGFAEPSASVAVGERLIDVTMEGETWLSAFDIIAQAGAAKTAVTTEAIVEITDGELNLDFFPNQASEQEAVVNSIVVEPDECAQNCDDGVFCNGAETCQAGGSCAQGQEPCVPDEFDCTDTCDEQSRACNVVKQGFCLIDGICWQDGSVAPDNPCLVCRPDSSTSSWSANDGASCDDGLWCNGSETCAGDSCVHQDAPCSDDGLECTNTCDEDQDLCNTLLDGYCLIDGVCRLANEQKADNQCLMCIPEVSPEAWSSNEGASCDDGLWCDGNEVCADGVCVHQQPPCVDDGLDCTDVCDESARECNKLLAGWCLIGGDCYTDGEVNVNNSCQACLAQQDAEHWSNDDGLACSDNNSCTGPDTCISGVCRGEAISGCCSKDQDCDDGNDCTEDVCNTDDGTCTNEIIAGHCSIGNICVVSGDFNPNNPCEHCDAAHPTVWTALSDGDACDDGLFCTLGETCLSGVCQGGVANDCDDGLECTVDVCDESEDVCHIELQAGWCNIQDTCVAEGLRDIENQCMVCDPSQNTTGWSFEDGMNCDDGDPCTGSDMCTGGECKGEVLCNDECSCQDDHVKIIGRVGCSCSSSPGFSFGYYFILALLAWWRLMKRLPGRSFVHITYPWKIKSS